MDTRARELIEKSRRHGWQTVNWPATNSDGEPSPFCVHADGAGRYRYERTTVHGLREIVLCDGATLRHVYPELGIGAERQMSPFHRSEILGLVPWLVPPADELALGADLRAIGPETVEIVPHGLAEFVEALRSSKMAASHPERRQDEGEKKGSTITYTLVHLVFSKAGRLAERRLIEMPTRKTLLKICYDPDGTARWLGSDGKDLGHYKLEVADVDPPELVPDKSEFVMLPMPRRSEVHVWKTLPPRSEPSDEKSADKGEYDDLSENNALALVAANLHRDFVKLHRIIDQRFFQQGDHRIGLYTLLLATLPRREYHLLYDFDVLKLLEGRRDGAPRITERKGVADAHHPNPPVDDPDSSPLERYIAWQLSKAEGHKVEPLRFKEGPEGFVQQLAMFQYLYAAIRERTVDAVREDERDSLERPSFQDDLVFIRNCKSPAFAFLLLHEATRNNGIRYAPLGAIATAYDRLEQRGYLSYALGYERACTLHRIGRQREARQAFEKLYRRAIERGGLPPVDARFVRAFKKSDATERRWEHLVKETGKTLAAERRYAQTFLLMSQCRQLGEDSLSRELLSQTLAAVDEADRFAVTLMAVAHLSGTGEHKRADSMLQPLLENETYNDLPELWQLAAEVANRRGMLARSLAGEDTSLDLRLSKLTDKVDVTQVRRSHSKLLERYEELAYAVATLDEHPSAELVGRVVRIADRWRSLDDEATGACQAAARVLQAVGEEELAWDYLTTPLALKPNEAVAWRSLAETLGKEQQYELADRAYAAAFEAERTNAELLCDRIELLDEAGRRDEARTLLKQLAEGDWQPRFQHLQKKAAERISQ
jgi:tetratricopeptide (TPR) repeat protein